MKNLTFTALAALALTSLPASAQIRTSVETPTPAAQEQPAPQADSAGLASLPGDGPVTVQWTDPAGFTELRYSNDRWQSQRGNWVESLARHLRQSASRQLSEGERLEVTITDIDLAGQYEPSHGRTNHDVRMLRETTPPKIDLSFRHFSAQGELIAEGERELRDLNYLSRPVVQRRNDSLRHEKRLLDDWLKKELAANSR